MAEGHYFEDNPSIPSKVRQVPLKLKDLSMELDVDRGVFSGMKIDEGTQILLAEAARPGKATTTILDVGCGYGPIACAVAHRAPHAKVWAVDVNERARGLCVANAKKHELNISVHAPEDMPADQTFDLIVSNPPIRIGKKNLHPLLELWLDRLAPGGRAELVVHKHLGSDSLQKWLIAHGWPTARLISRSGYRILVVKPRPERFKPANNTEDVENADDADQTEEE